jgi:malonyl CoA-acyl carrier protein transacylase
MFQKLKNMFRTDNYSISLDHKIVEKFSQDPNFPYLVSFPRTGSHWLRMLMELYFDRPTLVRAFYHFESEDYLLYHTHDMELDVKRQNVIYLYREPIATIYSQLQYHRQDFNDKTHITHWANLYGEHLDKWLVTETFATKKTILTYELMSKKLPEVMAKVAVHFGQPFDATKFEGVAQKVTKEEVKRKTPHDEQVVQLNSPYTDTREVFREKHEALVWETLLKNREHLKKFF